MSVTAAIRALVQQRRASAYCGCCGHGPLRHDRAWCVRCARHLAPRIVGGRALPPWDRTYLAQHDRDCPYQA